MLIRLLHRLARYLGIVFCLQAIKAGTKLESFAAGNDSTLAGLCLQALDVLSKGISALR